MRLGSPTMMAVSVLCLLVFLELVVASNNPFYTNSRYGKRVPGPASSVARIWGASRRRSDLEPRSDMFFLNSRYGKRAHAPPANHHAEQVGLMAHLLSEAEESSAETADLKCQYTGVHDLYRCFGSARKESNPVENGNNGSNTVSSSSSSEETQNLNN